MSSRKLSRTSISNLIPIRSSSLTSSSRHKRSEIDLTEPDIHEKKLAELRESKKLHEKALQDLRFLELQELQNLELIKRKRRKDRKKLERDRQSHEAERVHLSQSDLHKPDHTSTIESESEMKRSLIKRHRTNSQKVTSEFVEADNIIRFNTNSPGVTGFQSLMPSPVIGFVGSTGHKGPRGWIGATGLQGIGLQGPTGPEGGPVGSTGYQGATGPSGGPPGATGFVGPTGFVGSTGFKGSSGPPGPSGTIGATGPMLGLGSGLIYLSTNNSALCQSRYIGLGCDSDNNGNGFTDVALVFPVGGQILSYTVSAKGHIQPGTQGPIVALAMRSGVETHQMLPIDLGITQLSPDGGTQLPDNTCKKVTFSPPYKVNAFDCFALHLVDPVGWSNFELCGAIVFQAN